MDSPPPQESDVDCIFCKIARHEAQAQLLFENERIIAFRDIFAQAPTHFLVIPKTHHASLDAVGDEHDALLGELLGTARRLARELGVAASGYRTVINCHQDGGQSVDHLHLHVLAGRRLSWPPG